MHTPKCEVTPPSGITSPCPVLLWQLLPLHLLHVLGAPPAHLVPGPGLPLCQGPPFALPTAWECPFPSIGLSATLLEPHSFLPSAPHARVQTVTQVGEAETSSAVECEDFNLIEMPLHPHTSTTHLFSETHLQAQNGFSLL